MDYALFIAQFVGIWSVGFAAGYTLTIFRRAVDQV